MKDFTKNYPGRAYDEMFYANDDTFTTPRVQASTSASVCETPRVQAFKCPPNDDDVRWVPEFGCSTTSVHKTEKAAIATLVSQAKKEHAKLKQRMAAIEDFMSYQAVSR